ncbi:hypothetical protein E2562_027368 [Oryza meyeriana var. granulata]|uniref:Uncharacterized protein n=1 Tax=Oryza meyeriana var. granulata TaxID=110450 RepID=A0A6G1C9T2_9ORYZ|nr:hypothetical protein E2562_027368 [Oryza meyeriana var. granulata]
MEITLLTASDWPSDCGWNADDMWSLVPVALKRDVQKVEVNTGSLSETIDVGRPCRRTMSV